MISPFCSKCRAVILPGRSECPECREPVRDRPGVMDSLRKVEAPSTRRDLFCPSCHGLILTGDTRCTKCGMILPRDSARQRFRDQSNGDEHLKKSSVLTLENEEEIERFSTLDQDEEVRWREFLRPTARELENEFYFIKNHALTKNEDKESERASRTKFVYLESMETLPTSSMPPEAINAFARKEKNGYLVVLPLGQAVFDRLIGGILSAADLQCETTFKAKMSLDIVLREVLQAVKKRRRITVDIAMDLAANELIHLRDDVQLSAGKDIASWISRWTIAHEVGHVVRKHCDPHPGESNSDCRIGMEYEADKFANDISNLSAHREYTFMGGLVNTLAMIVGDPKNADKASPTHPAPLVRFEELLTKNTESAKTFSNRFNISLDELQKIAHGLMKNK